MEIIGKIFATGIILLVGASSAIAQAPWPQREITVFVNVGPGGQTDIVTRALAKELEKVLGKPVVVLNKPGAQSTLGPSVLAREKPDGYTFGTIAASNFTTHPHLMKVPYSLDDFEIVAAFGRYKFGVVVDANSPIRSMSDFMKTAESGRGLFYGAVSANIVMLQLAKLTGANLEHVGYKSGAEAVTALLGGQVPAIVQTAGEVMPFVATGRMRVIGALGSDRWPELPDVPTLRQQGFDVLANDSWVGLAFPKNTPRSVVAKFEEAVRMVMQSPQVIEQINALGLDARFVSGAEFRQILERGHVQIGKIVSEAGLAAPQ